MDPLIIGTIAGGLAGGAAVKLMVKLQPQRHCPVCKVAVPKNRKPANVRQALFGGWHCQNCGADLDRKGQLRNQHEGG